MFKTKKIPAIQKLWKSILNDSKKLSINVLFRSYFPFQILLYALTNKTSLWKKCIFPKEKFQSQLYGLFNEQIMSILINEKLINQKVFFYNDGVRILILCLFALWRFLFSLSLNNYDALWWSIRSFRDGLWNSPA